MHIARSKSCKSLYNEEDIKQLRDNSSRRVSDRKRSFYAENSEILRAKQRKYNKEHAEEIKAKQREYNKKHAEEIKVKQREYSKKHAEEIKAKQREYNEKHAEEIKSKQREYNKKHAEEIKSKQQNCRKKQEEIRRIEWQKEQQKAKEQNLLYIEKDKRSNNLFRKQLFYRELGEISKLKRHGIDENCQEELLAMENSIDDTYLEMEKEIDKLPKELKDHPGVYALKKFNKLVYSRWDSLQDQIQKDLETIANKFNYKLRCFKCAPDYLITCDKCKKMSK